jgi:hypothetical protein
MIVPSTRPHTTRMAASRAYLVETREDGVSLSTPTYRYSHRDTETCGFGVQHSFIREFTGF